MDSYEVPGIRARAAAAARALADGRLEWDDFLAEFGDVADPQVAELVALIAQEPEVGGFAGVRPGQYRSYRDAIERLIEVLEGDGCRGSGVGGRAQRKGWRNDESGRS